MRICGIPIHCEAATSLTKPREKGARKMQDMEHCGTGSMCNIQMHNAPFSNN